MEKQGQLWKIKRAIAQAGRVLTGRQMAGRGATIFADDVYLVSYPRSGNTWTRFLLGNFLHQTAATFSNIEQRVAEIYFNPDHVLRKLPLDFKADRPEPQVEKQPADLSSMTAISDFPNSSPNDSLTSWRKEQ